MGFLDRIKSKFSPPVVTKAPTGLAWFEIQDKLNSQTNGAPGTLTPQMTVMQALKRYRSWVYTCTNLIQRKVVETDYYLYKEVGQPNDEEYDRILQHPLIKLLKRPNKFQSGREFRQITQLHLDLTGMAFWIVLKNGLGVPGELHLMSPNWLVQIVLGDRTDRLIDKFVFAPPNQRHIKREYPYEEIVYFHYPNPENPVLPFSPLQPLSQVIDIDLMLQVYERDFFSNNARPDFAMKTAPGQDLMPEEAERILSQWEGRHRGPGKSFRPAILNGLDVVPLGMSARDFEFGALSEYVKSMILASYGVPDSELGLMGGANRASIVASEQKLVKGCIEPRLRLWEDVINSQLLPLFHNSSDLEFRHESALPKDDEWNLTETQGYLAMGMTTVNAERKKKGLRPYDSPLMDVPWMNGEPVRGCKPEADKIWKEKLQDMMGGGMAQPGMAPPGAPQPGMDPAMAGMLPEQAGMAPQMPSNAPAAQGVMGNLGGRPEGQALTTLLTAAARRTNTSLATLLNAARGRRGGLSALLSSHPEFEQLSNILDKNRQDQALTRLIQTNLKGYIENQLEGIDKMMFMPLENMYSEIDTVEEEYQRDLQAFYVRKGNQFSSIVEKMVHGFVEKGSGDGIDLESWRKEYESFVGPIIERGVIAGIRGGLEIIRKSGGDTANISPEARASEVAGRLLERSADLRESGVRKAITEVLQEGISSGAKTDDIAFAIRDAVGGDMNEHRAMTIARTELASAMNHGLDTSYDEINKSGLTVKEAVVYTALDERVCEQCMALHGEVAKSYVKDQTYYELPIHPNCRCVLRPIMLEK